MLNSWSLKVAPLEKDTISRRHTDLTGFALYVTMTLDVKAVFTEAWRGGRFLLENVPLFE